MVNYHKTLVTTLNNILPTYYEMTLNKDCKIPCISYMEKNNYSSDAGTTLGYSEVSYQVKVWGNNISDIQTYSEEVCEALRLLGWKRTSSGELYDRDSTMIQKVMIFEALFIESFEEE